MISPDFSVLLLAWDDADPSVAVLGGAALPPTLPLAYQLATQQPVLAMYPQLPAEGPAGGDFQDRAGAAPEKQPSPNNPAAPPAAPGVRQLPHPAPASPNPERSQELSHLVGLDDLTVASRRQLQTASGLLHKTPQEPSAAATRSQWPTSPGAAPRGQRQAPAAPYAGASPDGSLPQWLVPNSRPHSSPTVREAADLPPTAASQPNGPPLASSWNPGPAAFTETLEEVGAFEAFSAPEDDLTAAAAPASAPGPAPAASRPLPSGASLVLMPAPEGLNFRMIQYARRAAQLVRGRLDFGVIYAPNWPAWLAALEIRNSSGRPLVLYAAGLAADFVSPSEQGWLLEVERMTLRRAHLILVPDQGVHRRLREQYGASIGEVRVVAAADDEAVHRVLRETAMEVA